MAFFPLFVNLQDKEVLVVGADQPLSYQLSTLKMFGAHITIIAPSVNEEITQLAKDSGGQIELKIQDISPSDVYSIDIKPLVVIAASSNLELNATVYEYYHEQNIAVEDLSDLERCDFLFPAVVKKEDVVCAVSSGGKSSHVAHFVKGVVEGAVPENIGAINARMEEMREIVKLSIPDAAKRSEALRSVFNKLLEDDNQTEDSELDMLIAQFGG